MGIKTFKHGQQILREGDVNSGVYIIQSGRVLLCKIKGSDLVEIDELSKGDFLGLSAYYDKKSENTTASAIGNVSLLEVQKELLEQFRTSKKTAIFLKMLQFLSSKIHSQNEKIKKLQFFNKLHFDQFKKDEISLYHLKDILRMSWILLLCFNRYNFSISADFFEDLCAILLADFKIKPEKIIHLYVSGQVIVEDKKTRNLSLINADKLEFFTHFLLQNFIKHPRKLLLNKPGRQVLTKIISLKDNKNLFRVDEFGFTHTFRHDLVKACDQIQNAGLLIERLCEKGFFKREFDTSGQTELSFELYTFEEILRCYEIIDNFSM